MKNKKAQMCIDCYKKKKYNNSLNVISKPELKELIRTIPFEQIAKRFNVSSNAVRKWCDKYNLPRRKSEINKFTDEEWKNI